MRLDGTVVSYNAKEETGVIGGHDGARYGFKITDWLYKRFEPEAGLIVTFEKKGSFAQNIRVLGWSSGG